MNTGKLNLPTANLTLKSVASSAQDALNTGWYFNNINLRSLLQNGVYDKYELFNLCLIQLGCETTNANLAANNNSLTCMLNISGLNFMNQTYNPVSNNSTSIATCCIFNLYRGEPLIQNFYSNNAMTFKKEDIVNLYLKLTQITGAALASPISYPNFTFIFSIIPVVDSFKQPMYEEINTNKYMKLENEYTKKPSYKKNN